jgi:hypothetical protein
MSATIIAFPSTNSPVSSMRVAPRRYSLDITVPDARGFVLLDACVSPSLSIEFAKLMALYVDPDGFEVQGAGTPCITNYDRPKFSFDTTQPEPKGLVLIDACVPASLAYTFRDLVDGTSAPITFS